MSQSESTPLLQPSPDHDHDYEPPQLPIELPTRTKLTIFAATWTAVFLGALDSTIIATLSSSIASSFEAAHQLTWLATAYLLSITAASPLYGRLAHLLGRRRSLLIALSLFTLGTLFCALAPSMPILVIARFLAGCGGGGIMTTSSIIASDLVPLNRRGLVQGFANVWFGAGAALGGPLGGWLADGLGWRYAFIVQVPVLLLAMGLVAVFVVYRCEGEVGNRAEAIQRIDWWGSLVLVLWVGSLLLCLSFKNNQQYSWTDVRVLGTFFGFVGFFALFLHIEANLAFEPVLPIRMLKLRSPCCIAWTSFLISMVCFSVLYMYPIYLETVAGLSATEAGAHLIPNAVALALGSLFAGLVIRGSGRYRPITLAGVAVFGTGSVLMWTALRHAWVQWIAIIPVGFGFSSVTTSLLVGLMASVPLEDMAVATGLSYLFRYTGQVVGVGLNGAILQSVLVNELEHRITGPGAAEMIEKTRREASAVGRLPTERLREAARASYGEGLRAVFGVNLGLSVVAFGITCLVEEFGVRGRS
ncbi:hypothetical protein CROQUDRAFT_660198 [Cronartium quercuum f. sp. fusiforme G11]|uniref:Major facilitator superfamily (MFS) profile domain-containing protein n=1 Tax=Cronartium quercuum f. sp. fusiforme G11 TaxID=708437 RepID=A0A9P6NIJ6_9BASI|nr:hypothetical protein CROQUDRAFT_660198 [Cronartium quercuum f. sp. fusiforme G11]